MPEKAMNMNVRLLILWFLLTGQLEGLRAEETSPAGDTSPPTTPAPAPAVEDVKLTPTRGKFQLLSKEILYLSAQKGHLRLKVDLTGMHHQLRETSYHFQERLNPNLQTQPVMAGSSVVQCVDQSAGSLVSVHSLLMEKKGGPSLGQQEGLTSKLGTPGVLHENCTSLRWHDVKHLHGQHHYSHDISMNLLSRQSLSCLQGFEDQAVRFMHDQPHIGWGKSKRQFLGLIGLGVSIGFGVSNRRQINRLSSTMSSLDHQVQAIVGEQHLMADITGGLISAQATLQKTVLENKEMEQRTDSLAKMNALTQVSCHLASSLRHSFTELKNKQFPTDLFGQKELNKFIEEFVEKVGTVGLEPVFPGTAALFNAPTFSSVEEVDLPVFENKDGVAEKGAAGTEIGIHRWNATNGLYRHKLKTRVVLTKSNLEPAQAKWDHIQHDFPKSTFKKARKGLILHLLVPIPLKVKESGGFRVYRLAETLMTLKRKNETEVIEDSAAYGPNHPVPIMPDLGSGLLSPLKQALELGLHEVGSEFLNSCDKFLDGQVLICPENIIPSSSSCLRDIFHNVPHSADCLRKYKALDERRPHIKQLSEEQVQVYIPLKGQAATICPRGTPPVIHPEQPGLYECNLPLTCTLQVGKTSYTNLGESEMEAHVMLEREFEEVQQLIKISEVEEKEGWRKLHELKKEMDGEALNLADLQQRLEENLVQKVARVYPAEMTWFSFIAAAVIVTLILLGSLWLYREYRKRHAEATQQLSQMARQNWLLREHVAPNSGRQGPLEGSQPLQMIEMIPMV